jgi:hypothetical protein
MKKMMIGAVALSAAALLSTNSMKADTFSGYQVSREGAWCWFADPRAIHYENEQQTINASWLAYIDVHGNVKASQYDFLTGKRNEVLVRSYFQPDDHNNPTILVLPDERVLIIYSRHTDEPAFYYRVSKRAGDITELGEEKKIVTKNNTTYPSPFILSDDPTHFYMCWRGINWHPTIAKLTLPDANDDVTIEWGPYQIVQSTGARPYAKYCSNGKDKIYVTYTTGHPDNEQPNWVYCNVININASESNGTVTSNPTLEDINGTKLSTIADGTFNVNKTDAYKTQYPNTVVDATSGIRDWVWQIALDKDGNPIIPMVKISGGKDSHTYYRAKWDGSKWNVTLLANAGGKFHSSNTEYCYSGGEAIDPEDTNTFYLSIPTDGDNGKVFEIWKYTVDDEGTITSTEQITRNSVKNNVRPYVLNNHGTSPIKLAWLNGDYAYWMVNKNYPAGFPTSIQCDYNYPIEIGDIDTTSYDATYNKTVTANDAANVTMPAGNFTLSINLTLSSSAYYGDIVKSTGLTYSVAQSDQLPSATVNGTTYASTNRLLSSDDWASNSSGTNGDYWPTKLGEFNLSFTYDGAKLAIYRNGVIDQIIAAESLDVTDLKVSGFAGTLGDVVVYNKCLNQDELKAMIAQKSFNSISLPTEVSTDIVLPSKAGNETVTWTSSDETILSTNGTFSAPATATQVILTATVSGISKDFEITALPRDIVNNLVASYNFETADCYAVNGTNYVKDLSGNNYDLTLMGSAKADGSLNLTANTASGFSTNGYALVPAGVMDGLRSYTFVFDAKNTGSSAHPRFYDFGANSGNSLFCRYDAFSAGIKYSGGTTTMVNSATTLKSNTEYNVAVTFDARSKVTTIYLDGVASINGTANVNEPYMIAALASCGRNYIGRTQWWDSSVANDNQDFIGTYDNFRIFNTCLTADELSKLNDLFSSISAVRTDAKMNNNTGIYDIMGRKVKASATESNINSLAPGLYICNGEKMLVK